MVVVIGRHLDSNDETQDYRFYLGREALGPVSEGYGGPRDVTSLSLSRK